MSEKVDAIVIGAGVVGLACARELARAGLETLILERHATFGCETSSRNSEVVHAGIYYPQGSLKARLCVTGRELLYDFCREYGVAHRRCGKLIVATSDEQMPALAKIEQAALANGVNDLQRLDADEAIELEPRLRCVAALLSPSTGIVDSHAFMLALLGDAERHGATLARCAEVDAIDAIDAIDRDGERLHVRIAGDDAVTLAARVVVNACGLSAQRLAGRIAGFPADRVPPLYLAKGNYFALAGRAPFSRLVYPLPEPGGLGVHLTLDLGGQARFGPDVEWTDAIDYDVDARRGDAFYAEVRRYWPELADGALAPAYAGMRPKLSAPGAAAADFVIQGFADHGVAGLVNLFGIESPGLTASLALAAAVRQKLAVPE